MCAETVTRYLAPEPDRLSMVPVPLLPGDSAKSPGPTPATGSLKATPNTSEPLEVVALRGSSRVIDSAAGEIPSAIGRVESASGLDSASATIRSEPGCA